MISVVSAAWPSCRRFWPESGDPQELAALADPQVKTSKEVIAKSLQGNWRQELLFVLRQEVDMYRACQKRIVACDRQLRQHLQRITSRVDVSAKPIGPRPKGKRARGNAPKTFDLRSELYRLTGVDWTQVDGIDVQVAPTVISGSEGISQRKTLCQLAGAVSDQ